MGQNEEATLASLTSQRTIIDSLIEQHHGRFVNSAGDSVLAEFASVVNFVVARYSVFTYKAKYRLPRSWLMQGMAIICGRTITTNP